MTLGDEMKPMWKGFLLGVAITAIVAIVALFRYGAWREKIGRLQGDKEGMIRVVDFLAGHFPKPDGRPIDEGHQFSFKWYDIVVVETNGVSSLQVRNEM